MRRYCYQTRMLPRMVTLGTLMPAIVLLTACGAASTTSGAPTATPIRATATPLPPTSVTVLRFGGSAEQNHVAPLQRTSRDTTSVQRLYQAAYALPPASQGAWCPIDRFIGYELTFQHGDTVMLEVLLSGGCPSAKLVQSSTCRAWTPNFTAQMAATLGVPVTTLAPPKGLLNTAGPDGPFAPFGPTPPVSMPIRC
jgi:hypothetical protein